MKDIQYSNFEKPYETIWGIKDNEDGLTVTIYSTYDTSHPDCPIKLIPYGKK